MHRNRALIRNLTLLQLLERSRVGLNLETLASETGVTTRTIRRDLEALQAAGVPVVDTEDRHDRRWRVLNWRKEAA